MVSCGGAVVGLEQGAASRKNVSPVFLGYFSTRRSSNLVLGYKNI
jgi:hypothetical protein